MHIYERYVVRFKTNMALPLTAKSRCANPGDTSRPSSFTIRNSSAAFRNTPYGSAVRQVEETSTSDLT
jgi:hypothetical protein